MSLLEGKTMVVTAGGTREPIDAVRFIGNRSSGRMGAAIAEEARRRGAEVTLVAANLAVEAPEGVDLIEAPTAAELARETLSRGDVDVVVMAAAVADYRPSETIDSKRPKDAEPWRIELVPTEDVLLGLGAQSTNGRVVVAFAAETGAEGLERAREKRLAKDADLLVYNDVARVDIGFDSPDNEVVLISDEGERRIARAPKREIAAEILDEVERLLERRHGGASG